MQPADYLEKKANEPAVAMADSGAVVTYDLREEPSRRLTQLSRWGSGYVDALRDRRLLARSRRVPVVRIR